MKTLNGGESLPLSDLGCVLFSISCQVEHEEQTIADELEYENEKCRQPLWGEAELSPRKRSSIITTQGKRDLFPESFKDVHSFKVLRTEVWGQARLWVVWSGTSYPTWGGCFIRSSAVVIPGQQVVMGCPAKASLQQRTDVHCRWLKSREGHAADTKICTAPPDTREQKLWLVRIPDSGLFQELPTQSPWNSSFLLA